MKRRDFMGQSAGFGMIVAAAVLPDSISSAVDSVDTLASIAIADKLTPPAKGKIPVAFAISEGVTVIDFAGPWEVFQDVHVQERGNDIEDQMPFELFTVSEKTNPITGSGGLKLVPAFAVTALCAAAETPKSWVDPDTGHRVVRLTDEPGSASLYFNQNGYTADRKKMVYSTPDGISVFDFETKASRSVVTGRVRIIDAGRKTPNVYYTRAGSVFSTTSIPESPARSRSCRRVGPSRR